MSDFSKQKCVPCEGGVKPLTGQEVQDKLVDISGWMFDEKNQNIQREFRFKNFYHTMAFVNAIAYMAHQENHHPDLEVGYDRCKVQYTTHAISGLSLNDFICAAKVNAIQPE